MRIGISLLNFRIGKVGGIETYIRKIVEWAPQVADGDEVVFFVHRGNRQVIPSSCNSVEIDCSQREMDRYRLLEAFTPWRASFIERQIEAAGIDVMFYTQQSIFPIECSVPSLLFVADVQYLFYPHYFSFADLRFRRRIYLKSMQRATRLTTVSQFTADHVIERCGIAREKIQVIHHGFDPVIPPAGKPAVVPDQPYLYYPAASYPHKGHAALFRSFAELVRRGDLKHRLFLSGDRNAYWARLERIIRKEGMQKHIVHLGYISYQDVLALYQHADTILFPSEFEGFGLPVLEAVQLQKNIVCSRIKTFTELGVPDAWRIDFSDPDELLRAIRQTGPTRLEQNPISWQEAVRRTVNLAKETAR